MRVRRINFESDAPEPQPSNSTAHSSGWRETPIALPALPPSAPPEVAAELIERRAAELDAICASALSGGLGLRVATRLILAEHGPESKNAKAKGYSYDRRQVWTTIKRLADEWEADFKEFAHSERSRQVERLRQDLARQRAKANPSFQAIRGHEELLGRIMGTLQPIRVEVDVLSTLKVSLAAVIVDLTDDERDSMVREQLELESLARRSLPMATAAE